MAKHFLIKQFGEYIRQFLIGMNMVKINVPFSNMISNEMMTNFNMLGSRMLHGIMSNLNITFIVTKQWNMFHIDPIIFKSLVIQSNWAQHEPAAMYSASAVDRDTELCFLEDQDTRYLPRN